MIQTSVSEWKNLLPWLSSLLLMLYLPLNPSLPISCRTSFLSWLTFRKHGLEHLSEQHDVTLDTRFPNPDVERLGEVCCWLYPDNQRLGGLPPRLQRADILPAPICIEVPGLPEEPAGSHSQHNATHPERLLLQTETNWSCQEHQNRESHHQLHSSNCWLLPQRNCFQLYVLILRESCP